MKKILLLLALISPLLFSQEVIVKPITDCLHLDLIDTTIKADISCKGELKIYNSIIENASVRARKIILNKVKITGETSRKSAVIAENLSLKNVKVIDAKVPALFNAKKIQAENLKIKNSHFKTVFNNKEKSTVILKNSELIAKTVVKSKTTDIHIYNSFIQGNLMARSITAVNVVLKNANVQSIKKSLISNAFLIHTKVSDRVSINKSLSTDENCQQFATEEQMMEMASRSQGCGLIPGKLSPHFNNMNKTGLGLNIKTGYCPDDIEKLLSKSIYDREVDEEAIIKKRFETMEKRKPKKDTRSYCERNPDLC